MTDLRQPVYGKAAAELGARLAATPTPMHRMDVPAAVVEADVSLEALLAAPPLGHTKALQPADWYERVFDAMACAHPNTCQCTPQEAS